MPDDTPKIGVGGIPDINDPLVQAWMLNQQRGGGTISAPPTWKYIPIADPKDPTNPEKIKWVENQNYGKAPVTTAPVKRVETIPVQGVGVFSYDPYDPNTSFTRQENLGPSAEDLAAKQLERLGHEREHQQKEDNFNRGYGYVSDDELNKRNNEAARLGISADEMKLRWKDLDEKTRQFNINQVAQDKRDEEAIKKSVVERGRIGAETGRIGVETSKIGQEIQIAGQLLPGQLAQQGATLEGTYANTAQTKQATQIAGAPQAPQALPQGPTIYQYNPLKGTYELQMNPAYQPKTQAEIAGRVGQINALASQKSQELLARSDANPEAYSRQQAVSDFNAWYDQNVQPQLGALDAAQDEARFARTTADQLNRQNAYQVALGAGNQAITAFGQMQEGRVGPNFEAAMARAGQGKFDFPEGAFTYEAADPTETARQQTMEALKYISPTAAQATGQPMPNYAGMNIQEELNRQRYFPGGGQGGPAALTPMPMPAGAPPAQLTPMPMPAGAPPASMVNMNAGGPPDWNALMQRQLQDVDLQRQQAQVPGFGPAGSAYKPGWAGSDPRFSGIFNPYVYGG